jgi:hypothetical protein
MTVHQVEQYYLHIDVKESSKEAIEKAAKYIESEGYVNYEVCDDYLVVDDLEDESDAETLNDELNEILN